MIAYVLFLIVNKIEEKPVEDTGFYRKRNVLILIPTFVAPHHLF